MVVYMYEEYKAEKLNYKDEPDFIAFLVPQAVQKWHTLQIKKNYNRKCVWFSPLREFDLLRTTLWAAVIVRVLHIWPSASHLLLLGSSMVTFKQQ